MGDIVLLVNRGLCNNLGDQAINNSFKAFLESNFSSEVFFADYTSTSKLVEPINCKEHRPERAIFKKILPLNMIWFFRNFYRVFTAINKVNPNLVVIGGGQLLLSNRFSIAAFTWVFFAKLLGVRVVFSNVGAGRSFSYFNKYLVKYALKRSDGINLRDPRSKFFLEKNFDDSIKLHESADIVFTSLPNASVHSKKYKALLGIPCLSVYNTYNPKVDRESYYKIWLDFLVDNGVDIKSCKLVYTTKEDYIETLKFEAYFSSAFGFDLEIENCHTLNDFNSVLSEAEIIISGRMHALILGLNHGAKNLVFPISDKLEEYSLMCSGKGEIEYIRSVAVNETIDFLSRFLKNDVK